MAACPTAHARWTSEGICEACGIQGVEACPDCGDEFQDFLDEHEDVTTQAQADALSLKFRDCSTCNNKRHINASAKNFGRKKTS